jgi:hypothetical protein
MTLMKNYLADNEVWVSCEIDHDWFTFS